MVSFNKALIRKYNKGMVTMIEIIIYSILEFITSNFYILNINPIVCIIIGLLINFFPVIRKLETKKLKNVKKGYQLLELFLISTTLSIILNVGYILIHHKISWTDVLFVFLFELVIFWNGITRVYISSSQLALRHRARGIIFGMIPILHLIALIKIIVICRKEVKFENEKIIINKKRRDKQICKTKYPILMVHGIFFRDFRYFNYWGRIPKELEENGATIYYGNQESAATVIESAKQISDRIKEIIKNTNCEKVNIIAHSKGGLDCRYAIGKLGMDKYVASLTMINTPNRGCEYAEYLIKKTPKAVVEKITKIYNDSLKKLGDKKPDFINSVKDLTYSACENLNNELLSKELELNDTIYYQSVGSELKCARGGRFPLNLTTDFIKNFDGLNDGLVGESSFKYGKNYIFIRPKKNRGISHGDMIDMNKENIDGFDVREFYVELVRGLKEKGL